MTCLPAATGLNRLSPPSLAKAWSMPEKSHVRRYLGGHSADDIAALRGTNAGKAPAASTRLIPWHATCG